MKRNQLNLECLRRGTYDDNKNYLDPFIELYTLNHDDYIFDDDSDLDELFADSGIKCLKGKRVDGLKCNNYGIIIDDRLHYKNIGHDYVEQDGVKYVIPVLCIFNGCVYCEGYDLLKIKKL